MPHSRKADLISAAAPPYLSFAGSPTYPRATSTTCSQTANEHVDITGIRCVGKACQIVSDWVLLLLYALRVYARFNILHLCCMSGGAVSPWTDRGDRQVGVDPSSLLRGGGRRRPVPLASRRYRQDQGRQAARVRQGERLFTAESRRYSCVRTHDKVFPACPVEMPTRPPLPTLREDEGLPALPLETSKSRSKLLFLSTSPTLGVHARRRFFTRGLFQDEISCPYFVRNVNNKST